MFVFKYPYLGVGKQLILSIFEFGALVFIIWHSGFSAQNQCSDPVHRKVLCSLTSEQVLRMPFAGRNQFF